MNRVFPERPSRRIRRRELKQRQRRRPFMQRSQAHVHTRRNDAPVKRPLPIHKVDRERRPGINHDTRLLGSRERAHRVEQPVLPHRRSIIEGVPDRNLKVATDPVHLGHVQTRPDLVRNRPVHRRDHDRPTTLGQPPDPFDRPGNVVVPDRRRLIHFEPGRLRELHSRIAHAHDNDLRHLFTGVCHAQAYVRAGYSGPSHPVYSFGTHASRDMPTCKADSSIARVETAGFKFPLGVYPVEELTPKAGYTLLFEPADGDESEGEWEEWPDRYVFDAVVSADRVDALCRALFAIFRSRVYPILDILGRDEYREIDPYISYDLLGLDRFLDGVRQYRDFLFEDGLCGFGAMTEAPFFYVFVDEHKIVTIRAEPELKERVEKILHAFDLQQMEDPAGADSAAHEHRGVLMTPPDRPDLLSSEEIVERLRDDWRLLLNINTTGNTDDEGNELGTTLWHCIVRCWSEETERPHYAEAYITADSLEMADETAKKAAEGLKPPIPEPWTEMSVVQADRLRPERLPEISGVGPNSEIREPGRIISARWLE